MSSRWAFSPSRSTELRHELVLSRMRHGERARNGTDLVEHRFPVHPVRPLALSKPLTPHKNKQIFVANPKKPPQIEAILRRNKDKLVAFLRNFHNDRDDEQFNVRADWVVCP